MLIAAINAIPDATSIKKTAELTFGKEAVRRDSYLSAIEVLREYKSDSFNEMINLFNKEPWLLIYKFSGPGSIRRMEKGELEKAVSEKPGATQSNFFIGQFGSQRKQPLPNETRKYSSQKASLAKTNIKSQLFREIVQ